MTYVISLNELHFDMQQAAHFAVTCRQHPSTYRGDNYGTNR